MSAELSRMWEVGGSGPSLSSLLEAQLVALLNVATALSTLKENLFALKFRHGHELGGRGTSDKSGNESTGEVKNPALVLLVLEEVVIEAVVFEFALVAEALVVVRGSRGRGRGRLRAEHKTS